ncbi:MAG: hypothetical protein HYT06_01565 [Candidatus Levybacteria bacterium]|nr:hypothetical protein [Candidatus Levybacteria bacterium]
MDDQNQQQPGAGQPVVPPAQAHAQPSVPPTEEPAVPPVPEPQAPGAGEPAPMPGGQPEPGQPVPNQNPGGWTPGDENGAQAA